jgi:DNA polymerase III subunit delta'
MIPLLIVSDDNQIIDRHIDKLKKDALFIEIVPKTKEYSIEDIKDLIKETNVFHPFTRFYYLANFHLSSIPAQNSFLKLLEEPPENVQFILTTKNKYSLLPTIISRVKIIKLNKQKKLLIDKSLRTDLERLIKEKDLKILNRNYFDRIKKEEASSLLDQIIIFFREALIDDINSPLIIKEIIRLKALLNNNNLNPQLTIDQALIFIWKKYRIK